MFIPDKKYFRIEEFLPREFYHLYKYKGDLLWLLFDDRALWTQEAIRKRYGRMVLNDWLWRKLDPKANRYRGFRPFDCKIGATLSQHKFGRALDPIPSDVTAEELRQDVLNHPTRREFQYITCIEMNVSWFHFDVRNWDVGKNGILKVYP